MIIGSISENKEKEKRISITPEIAKKYVNLGFEVQLSEKYGKHLGFEEKDYKDIGVKFVNDDKKIIENSNIIIQINLLDEDNEIKKWNEGLLIKSADDVSLVMLILFITGLICWIIYGLKIHSIPQKSNSYHMQLTL